MSFEISVQQKKFIQVVATKDTNFNSTSNMVQQIIKLSLLTSISSFFFNFRDFATPITPFETYELFELTTGHNFNFPLKIAFVQTSDKTRQDQYHAENVGINSGFIVKGCTNEKEAVEWLLSNSYNNLVKN